MAAAVLCGCSPSSDEDRRDRIERMYGQYRRDFADAPEITVAGLIEARKAGQVVLVDARAEDEMEVSMLPGAITKAQFDRRAEKLRDRRIVVYCTIGSRSGHLTRELVAKGLRAANLKGGILAWTHAGQELVSRELPTKRVHVYCQRWNLAAAGYRSVFRPDCNPPGE